MVAADLLLALDDEFEVDRLVSGLDHRLEGLDVHEHLALVVTRTPGKDGALGMQFRLADDRLERRGSPEIERIRRLDVVVSIDEDRRQGRVHNPLPVHDRIAGGLHDLHTVGPRLAQVICHGFRAADHVFLVGWVGTDGRNAEQVEQLIEKAVPVGGEEILCGHGCKVARTPASGNGPGTQKERGGTLVDPAPPAPSAPEPAALGGEEDIPGLIGEFDADDFGTVRQGGDEGVVGDQGLGHVGRDRAARDLLAIGKGGHGAHRHRSVHGEFHGDGCLVQGVGLGGDGVRVGEGGAGGEGEGDSEEGGGELVHDVGDFGGVVVR